MKAADDVDSEQVNGSIHTQRVKRDQQRLADLAAQGIHVSTIEALTLAAKADPILCPPEGMTQEQLRTWYMCETESQRKALQKFRDELLDREREAFCKGADSVSNRRALFASEVRSFILLLVVLGVLSMPFIAIWKDLPPEHFGTLIAPVTALAGTVVGYWFGAGERHKSGKDQ
jgi:hypothetical protein